MASSPAVDQDAKYFSGNTFKDSMRELLCGIVSGFVCKVVEYPFDTLKVIMQVGFLCLIPYLPSTVVLILLTVLF